MGTSAVFFNIESINNKILAENTFSLEEQRQLDDFDVQTNKLGLPKTDIKQISKTENFIKYEVTFSTDTVKKSIYIYQDGYEEYNNGFQYIEKFEMWINKDKNLLILFTPKHIANQFLRRLKRYGYIKEKPIIFDFSKINELENMDSAWGVWEDSEGIIKRVAKFGKGLTKELEDYGIITTIYIDYIYGEECLNLILSKYGRISSPNNIKKEDLVILFNEIASIIKKDKLNLNN